MIDGRQDRWQATNLACLRAELSRIRKALVRHAAAARAEASADKTSDPLSELAVHRDTDPDAQPPPKTSEPPAFLLLRERFSLSQFELDVLLLCAGFECDDLAAVSGQARASFGLALAALPDGHFDALSPEAPLRRHHLVRLGSESSLLQSPLQIEECILFYLLGVAVMDERLRGVLHAVPEPGPLSPTQRLVIERARSLLELQPAKELPVLWLCGPDARSRRDLCTELAAEYGLTLYALQASDIPKDAASRQELLTLWAREQLLAPAALLLSYKDSESQETLLAAAAFLDRAVGLLLVSGRRLERAGDRPVMRLDVPQPNRQEQLMLWQAALGEAATPLNGALEKLATQFQLGPAAIEAAAVQALGRNGEQGLSQALWESCRLRARPHLDELAQRIEGTATFSDLVLPEAQEKALREIVAHHRHQAMVYHRWGFARRGARGLGIAALFVGQSGTGKTLAAEVIAQELGLDLYRIDLSQIVSKYIGETEKNLRRVFDAADEGGAVLLFDEADALFGKRTEVKDSHDRYANIEVSYLLQRMESYQGVSILTSNMRSALDNAFVRRLRFIIHFPFPDVKERIELWRRALPAAAPQSGISLDKLARLSVAGGHIRNIALGAAFLAAEEQQPLSMRHLLRSARSELAKLERPVNEAEVGGWS